MAEVLEDWLDANLKTTEIRAYDSSEHMQFGVHVSQAMKRAATATVLCLTDRFVPLQFALPQFQSATATDPECSKGKIFAVAMRPLRETEILPVIDVIDAHSGSARDCRRRFIERVVPPVAPPRKKRSPRKTASPGATVTQNVGKARDVVAAGRDVNYVGKQIHRTSFTPDERHITSEQAAKIKALIDELVEMDASAGVEEGKSYQKWWKMFNNTFKLTTYRELPREQFEEAASFLRQAKARNLPKIRRKDNELWRQKHYKTIFGNAKVLGWSKEDIYAFASEKLSKPVDSLSDLGEQNLARLARMIRAEAKKR